MDALSFFEEIATSVHYDGAIDTLVNVENSNIKKIFESNDSDTIRKCISGSNYFADAEDITQL